MTQMLIKPSTILLEGLRLQVINNLVLFKFTEELGTRMQELPDRKKNEELTPDEVLELDTIGELDNIFSYLNAGVAVQAHAHS